MNHWKLWGLMTIGVFLAETFTSRNFLNIFQASFQIGATLILVWLLGPKGTKQ